MTSPATKAMQLIAGSISSSTSITLRAALKMSQEGGGVKALKLTPIVKNFIFALATEKLPQLLMYMKRIKSGKQGARSLVHSPSFSLHHPSLYIYIYIYI